MFERIQLRLRSFAKSATTRLPQARIERAIIASRVVLSVGGSVAIYLDHFQHFEPLTYVPLGAYLAFSFLMLSTYAQPRGGVWPLATHIVEVMLICLILTRTDGPASPFFIYFTFVILAGALRWQWPGALITGGALGSALLAMTATQLLVSFDQAGFTDLILRNVYLLVFTVLFAYLGSEWHRSGQVLERLQFADEIHDGLLQTLSAIRLKAFTLAACLHKEERRRAMDIAQLLGAEQDRLRFFISEVRDAYPQGGSESALPIGQVQEVTSYLERLWGTRIQIKIDTPSVIVPRPFCFGVREIIMDSVTNAVLQGMAQNVSIGVKCAENSVRLQIQDDRRVFPETDQYETEELVRIHGPSRTVKERVDNLEGVMRFTTLKDGMLLEIELPVRSVVRGDGHVAAQSYHR